MLDPDAVAAMRVGMCNPIDGGIGIGADRPVGAEEIIAIIAIVLHTAAPTVVDDIAVIASVRVHGREHMIEVGQMHYAHAGRVLA